MFAAGQTLSRTVDAVSDSASLQPVKQERRTGEQADLAQKTRSTQHISSDTGIAAVRNTAGHLGARSAGGRSGGGRARFSWNGENSGGSGQDGEDGELHVGGWVG